MTWSVDSSGTASVTLNTEFTIVSTNNGTFVFEIDLNNMALGDITELRVYVQIASTGSLRQIWKSTYGPNPGYNTGALSPPIASNYKVQFSIKQVAGTARSYDYQVLRI